MENEFLHTYIDEYGNKIFHYHFPSITSLVEYIKTTPINSKVFKEIWSEAIDEPGKNIRGESLGTTLYNLIYGYSETYDYYRQKSNVDRIHIEQPINYERVRPIRSYVGSRVDMRAYEQGRPKNMLRPVRTVQKEIINFNFEASYLANINQNQVINRGIIAMLIIKALEQNNLSVNLNCFAMYHQKVKCKSHNNEIFYLTINLKDVELPINEIKCIGPFMRIEFLKRVIFRVLETTDLDPLWEVGYGYGVDDKEKNRIIKAKPDDITFGDPQKMGIKGDDLEEDLESAIESLNLKDIITLRKRLQ